MRSIWEEVLMGHTGNLCMYVDNLLFAVDNPDLFIKQAKERFILKGTEPTQQHLGCDDNGTLFMDPIGYIKQMEEYYVTHFKGKLKIPSLERKILRWKRMII